jgi:outer membrane lipoprotein-sorting protein
VADGDVLWTHEPQSRQVLRQSYASLPFPFSLIATPQKLDIDYSVSIADSTTVGRPGDIVLRMVPKDRRHLPKDLLVAVDPQTGIIGSLVFHDRAGSSVEMTFTDVEVNVGQDDTKFRFSVPAATQVLRGTPLP